MGAQVVMNIAEWHTFARRCLVEYKGWVKTKGSDQVGRAVAALQSMAATCKINLKDC